MRGLEADRVFGDEANGRAGHADAVKFVEGEFGVVLQSFETTPEKTTRENSPSSSGQGRSRCRVR